MTTTAHGGALASTISDLAYTAERLVAEFDDLLCSAYDAGISTRADEVALAQLRLVATRYRAAADRLQSRVHGGTVTAPPAESRALSRPICAAASEKVAV